MPERGKCAYLLPLPPVNAPSGHISAHPLLQQDWQGNTRSHCVGKISRASTTSLGVGAHLELQPGHEDDADEPLGARGTKDVYLLHSPHERGRFLFFFDAASAPPSWSGTAMVLGPAGPGTALWGDWSWGLSTLGRLEGGR